MSSDDTRPDTFDPDELVSAFLDDEVDASERSRVEADPALRARVEPLARVRAALSTPPEPSDELREATIAAVLAATVDTTPSATTAAATTASATVTSLASRRRSRTVWAVVAAAAMVLVAVPAALVALSQRTATEKFAAVGSAIDGGESSVTVTESSPNAPAADSPGVATGSDGAARAGGAVTTTAPSMSANADASAETSGAAALGDLGPFDRPEDLAAAVVPEGLAAPSTTVASSDPSSTAVPPSTVAADRSTTTTMPVTTQPTCVDVASAVLPSTGQLVRSATATYQGVPVEVLVFGLTGTRAGEEWLVVLDRADCTVMFDQAL